MGLDKNTWVVFTSDNGPWLSYKQAGGSAGPLRDGKNSHCEGGFRVPCIMWGGMVKPGHITQMGSSLDLLPTCCEMVGVNLPAGIQLDGVSLLNVLQDNLADSKREEFFFYRGSLLYAVRKGKYKLHYMNKSAYGSDPVVVYDKPKLYDLGTDPEEKYDIAGQYPEVVKELDQIATRHKASFEVAESIFDLK